MQKVSVLWLTLALLAGASIDTALAGQFTDPLDGRFDASTYLAENAFGFLPVPIIITDPAVDGGLGAIGIFFHESEEDKDKRLEAMKTSENAARYLITPSVTAVTAAKTGNDSWFAGAGHMGMFKKGDIRYTVFAGYADFNLDFYGTGDFQLPEAIEINTQASLISNSLKFRLLDTSFFIGVLQRYSDAEISSQESGGGVTMPFSFSTHERLNEILQLPLKGEITTSGLGFSLEFDSRDNNFSPIEGYQYQLDFINYSESVGSDVDYYLTTFTGLNYWKPGESFRTALKIGGKFIDTEEVLPPFALPYIELRGVPSARYQGKKVVMTELELTWEIDSRWSVLAFGGAGRASSTTDGLKDSSTVVSQGVGFRYLIARSYGFHVGVDIARGPEETVFYIQAGSAW